MLFEFCYISLIVIVLFCSNSNSEEHLNTSLCVTIFLHMQVLEYYLSQFLAVIARIMRMTKALP